MQVFVIHYTLPNVNICILTSLAIKGVSPSLKILITSEALLNDGVALVLFNLFFNSLVVSKNEDLIGASNITVYFGMS